MSMVNKSRSGILALAFLFLPFAAVYTGTSSAAAFEVVKSFDVPDGYQPKGLAWDGSHLWLSTASGSAYNIHRLTTDGVVVSTCNAASIKPSGLAWDGTHLRVTNTSNDIVYRLDTDCGVESWFAAPGPHTRGAAWEGETLWLSDLGYPITETDVIYQVTPGGSILKELPLPVQTSTDLAWDGEYLWLASSTKLYRINTAGEVLEELDRAADLGLPPSLAALAWDGSNLWVALTDKKIYQLIPNLPTSGKRRYIGATSVSDLNGNGFPETAVLYELRKPENDGSVLVSYQVRINDSNTGAFVKNLGFFGSDWEALAVTGVDDLSGNFVSEIAVLAVYRSTGASQVKIVDPATKEVISSQQFLGSGWQVKDLMQVDTDNDTWPEIGVLATDKATGRGILRIADPQTGDLVKTISLPK